MADIPSVETQVKWPLESRCTNCGSVANDKIGILLEGLCGLCRQAGAGISRAAKQDRVIEADPPPEISGVNDFDFDENTLRRAQLSSGRGAILLRAKATQKCLDALLEGDTDRALKLAQIAEIAHLLAAGKP